MSVNLTDILNLVSSGFDTLTNTRQLDTNNPGLGQSRYNFNYRSFPKDLTADYNSHYMVININVPVRPGTNEARSSYYNAGGNFNSNILGNNYSSVDVLRFGTGTQNIPGVPSSAEQRELYSPQRNTRRIAESIALYMPSPIIFNQLNVYEEISLTSIMGQAGKLAAGAVGQLIGSATSAFNRRTAEAGRQGGNGVGNLIDAAGNVIGTGFALAGYPINPRIEVLFSTTPQRQFNFEFLLSPRSKDESDAMKNIIQTLRFHAAPEITEFLGIVPTFIPPAEFDITFYKGGVENTNIPRINTCVLERCEVDYAPTGVWSTFSNGHPVAARLSLAFRELEIVHKRRVVQGF